MACQCRACCFNYRRRRLGLPQTSLVAPPIPKITRLPDYPTKKSQHEEKSRPRLHLRSHDRTHPSAVYPSVPAGREAAPTAGISQHRQPDACVDLPVPMALPHHRLPAHPALRPLATHPLQPHLQNPRLEKVTRRTDRELRSLPLRRL